MAVTLDIDLKGYRFSEKSYGSFARRFVAHVWLDWDQRASLRSANRSRRQKSTHLALGRGKLEARDGIFGLRPFQRPITGTSGELWGS